MDMEWWVSQPKIELHAHLNGSIRDSTLLELARVLGEKGVLDIAGLEHVIKKNCRSLPECFKLFDLIHVLTTDHATVTRITKEVVEDFAAENIVYLELRTTPKKNESIGMSKRSYMDAVIRGLRTVDSVDVAFIPSQTSSENSITPVTGACETTRKKIYIRLLLSIDRRETTAAALETVQLALEMRDLGVVGIDLSGNPIVGKWYFLSATKIVEKISYTLTPIVIGYIYFTIILPMFWVFCGRETFLPALKFAKEQGLLVTLHCGEVRNRKEIQAMLDFVPQRIGHACFLEEEDWEKLKSSKIPVEICLTSNIMTQTIASLDDHHFVDLYNMKHPLVLCTDDAGVFSTSLSQEYSIAASSFGIGKWEMFQLARDAIEFVFADDTVKKDLREIFDSAERKLRI